MDARPAKGADFKSYPYLDSKEFAEVCHHLDRRYTQAVLGHVRQKWKLRVYRALDFTCSTSAEYTTYLQIVRPLDNHLDDENLSFFLDHLTLSEEARATDETEDHDMRVAEESDSAALHTVGKSSDFGYVTYEVHLHPVYQAPCLWFNLHGLPVEEQAFNIDTVYRRLVPDQYKDGLRQVGGIGGISADHHPVTGIPSFFVHPCFLSDQISAFECSKDNYLMVWLGLVGGCVGLWVPKEMAIDLAAASF